MAVFENFPYTNFHELNLDWIIKEVTEYIIKADKLEEFVNTSIENQNRIIAEAVEELETGLEDLREYIYNNLQVIANNIINELIEQGVLNVGTTYNAETEELTIVITREDNNG